MKTIKNALAELASLTQIHLQAAYDSKGWAMADSENYAFFKKEALAKKPPSKHSPQKVALPQAEQPSLPVAETAAKPDKQPSYAAPSLVVTAPAQKKAAVPAKVPIKEEKAIQSITPLTLEPPIPSNPPELSDIRTFFTDKYSQLPLLDPLPSNSTKSWHIPPVAILMSADESPEHRTFLQKVSDAVSASLARAELIILADSKELTAWSEAALHSPDLLLIATLENYAKGIAKIAEENKLKKAPMIILEPIQAYLQSQTKKQQLWKMLQSLLNTPRSSSM